MLKNGIYSCSLFQLSAAAAAGTKTFTRLLPVVYVHSICLVYSGLQWHRLQVNLCAHQTRHLEKRIGSSSHCCCVITGRSKVIRSRNTNNHNYISNVYYQTNTIVNALKHFWRKSKFVKLLFVPIQIHIVKCYNVTLSMK